MLLGITPTLKPAPVAPYCARTLSAPWVTSPSGSLTAVCATSVRNACDWLNQGREAADWLAPVVLRGPL